jgi:hypothetical protein
MYYKPDWDEVRERLLAWWNHAVLDRCCVAVHAPRKDSKLPVFPDLQHGPWLGGLDQIPTGDRHAVRHWWQNPELNYQRAIAWFENNYFGGEALPVTYINWGAMALAAMLGSPAEFNDTSVWYPAVIEDWADWEWAFDPHTNLTWQTILQIVERFIQDARRKYLVGSPELGNGADVLSLMRGMDRLAMDLILEPEAVKSGVDFISDVWVQLMEHVHGMTQEVNEGGVLAWMGLWAPGRIDQIACDFSSVISPAMFREFFVPEIVKMGNWCEYGVYHLDGPACMKNMLDVLLEIPQIKTIQFTPGVGSPPTSTEAYVPRYKRILNNGRNLYLLVQPDEVEKLLTELPPEGLYMRTYVETQDEADEMIRKVYKWTARKNIFVHP